MSSQTIGSVALNVIGHYNVAGKHLAHAYRSGVERAIGSAGSRYSTFVQNRSIPLVNDEVKANLIAAQHVLAGFMVKRLQAGSDRAVQAMDSLANRTSSGIGSVTGATARIETAFDVSSSTVDNVRALNMPVAHIALQLAEKIAEGAKAIDARVNVVEDGNITAVAKAAVKPARRTARKA